MRPAGPFQTAVVPHAPVSDAGGGIVRRDRLFARLGGPARVTYIAAPAGSGKTVRLGEIERAEAWIAEVGGTERGEMRCALAVLRLAQGDPQAATAALAPIIDGSASVTNCGWLTQAFLLEAIVRDALGDPATAGRALEHALDLAEPDGMMFAFLLHPAPELLRHQVRQRTAHAALIAEILDVIAGKEREPARSEPVRLREPLSESETRVLRYLPTNLSVPEVADELSLSVNPPSVAGLRRLAFVDPPLRGGHRPPMVGLLRPDA